MMQDQEPLLHGNDSREYKFYPKVLGVAVDVLMKVENFDLAAYLQLIDDDRANSVATTDDIDNLLV